MAKDGIFWHKKISPMNSNSTHQILKLSNSTKLVSNTNTIESNKTELKEAKFKFINPTHFKLLNRQLFPTNKTQKKSGKNEKFKYNKDKQT